MYKTVQHPSGRLRRAFYESLAKVFNRIEQQERGKAVDFDTSTLKSILFGPEEIEMIRLARADSIVAVGKGSTILMSRMSGEIRRLREEEKSGVVRSRLPDA